MPGERELAWLAGRQYWCLHRRQLLAAGVGRRGIAGRLRRGQLHPLHRDVYLYGRSDQSPFSREMAALLHLRGDAVLSDISSAWVWDLSDIHPETVVVTLAGRNAHPMPGVTIRRVRQLHREDVRWRKGLAVTAPARTVCDFAGQVSLPRAESAMSMLRRRQLATDDEIRATLERLPANHRGAVVIRRLLSLPPGDLVLTKSIYERKLRDLLRQAGLPSPLSNAMVAGFERDLVWSREKLIVEFDGWQFHKDTFRSDRARDAAAVAAGWRVIRLTADRVDGESLKVIAEIAAALQCGR